MGKLLLGVTLDESYNDDEDLNFDVNGITVVIDKVLYSTLNDIEIVFDAEKGIVVSHKNSV